MGIYKQIQRGQVSVVVFFYMNIIYVHTAERFPFDYRMTGLSPYTLYSVHCIHVQVYFSIVIRYTVSVVSLGL